MAENKKPAKLDGGMIRSLTNFASMLFSRSALAARAGMTFRGKRNLFEVLGYHVNPQYPDFLARYMRGGVAHRVATALPLACWERGFKLDGGSAFNDRWDELDEKFSFKVELARLDIMLALGRYAALFIGFDDGRKSNLPVFVKQGMDLLFVQAYSEGSSAITSYSQDPQDPNFGLPATYEFSAVNPPLTVIGQAPPSSVVSTLNIPAHGTRVIHAAYDTLEDKIFGTPRLLPVLNYLDDLDKITGGSAETYWMIANRGMQIDVDKEMELDEEDAANLSLELEEFQHQLRRMVRTRGVKINQLGAEPVRPIESFQVALSVISATTGIPQRILLGSEAGSLASAQDRANWANRVEEHRSLFAEPKILKPFINRLITAGVLPVPSYENKKGDLNTEWPDAFIQNPLEVSQTQAQTARSIVNMSRQASEGNPITTIEESREILGLPRDPKDQGTPFKVLPSKLVVPATSITPPAPTYEQTVKDKAAQAAAAPPKPQGSGKPNGTGKPSASAPNGA